MTLAKITRPGLAALAICVSGLWGCLVGERVMVAQAAAEQIRALRDLELLRQQLHARPVSAPLPPQFHRHRSAAG